jgi:uncharacterized membrane protein YeaQ/YmgE (transglycosylase-associated protein family)
MFDTGRAGINPKRSASWPRRWRDRQDAHAGDVFRNMSGPTSWLASIALGLAGAILGYLIFTVGLGIGDTDIFDFGGIISAIIGTVIVILIAGFFLRRRGTSHL